MVPKGCVSSGNSSLQIKRFALSHKFSVNLNLTILGAHQHARFHEPSPGTQVQGQEEAEWEAVAWVPVPSTPAFLEFSFVTQMCELNTLVVCCVSKPQMWGIVACDPSTGEAETGRWQGV